MRGVVPALERRLRIADLGAFPWTPDVAFIRRWKFICPLGLAEVLNSDVGDYCVGAILALTCRYAAHHIGQLPALQIVYR